MGLYDPKAFFLSLSLEQLLFKKQKIQTTYEEEKKVLRKSNMAEHSNRFCKLGTDTQKSANANRRFEYIKKVNIKNKIPQEKDKQTRHHSEHRQLSFFSLLFCEER